MSRLAVDLAANDPAPDRRLGGMAHTVDATLGVVLREFRVQRRYPVSLLNSVLLTPLYEMVLPSFLLGAAFLVGGEAIGLSSLVGTSDLAGWLALGAFSATVMTAIVISVNNTIATDRTTGVLEYSWTAPISRRVFVYGGVVTGTTLASIASLLILLFAVGVLGSRYSVAGLLAALPAALISLVGLAGGGYLVAATTIAVRRPGPLIEQLTGIVVVLSGVTFPVTILPDPVRAVTYTFPSTWGLDLVRHLAMGSTPLAPLPVEVGALVLSSVTWFVVGRAVFARAERSAATRGLLTQY